MRSEQAFVGARVVDSLPFSLGGTAAQARALRASGIDGLVGYLGHMTSARLADVLAAGLTYMPVTIAGEYEDGAADEIAQLRALGVPAGVTVWLDLEGTPTLRQDPAALARKVDSWAVDVAGAGYQPGLYLGVPQPLTSDELWRLRVVRYWQGMGSIRDRHGALAEPTGCGWCMRQLWHGGRDGGGQWWPSSTAPERVFVDVNAVCADFRGRLPTWTTK